MCQIWLGFLPKDPFLGNNWLNISHSISVLAEREWIDKREWLWLSLPKKPIHTKGSTVSGWVGPHHMARSGFWHPIKVPKKCKKKCPNKNAKKSPKVPKIKWGLTTWQDQVADRKSAKIRFYIWNLQIWRRKLYELSWPRWNQREEMRGQ